MTTKEATKIATMETKELREALQKANFVKSHGGLPVLSNALIECIDGKTTITTTDMERTVRITIDSTTNGIASTLLPRKTTSIFLNGANEKVSITKGKTEQQITLSREDIGDMSVTVPLTKHFPPIPPPIPKNADWHTLDAKWFCSMLSIVSIASANESHPVLNGVAFNDGAIAAADGFRLTVLKDNRLAFGLKGKQVIVPLDTINLVVKLFRKEKTLEMRFESSNSSLETRYVHFRVGNVTLTSELIQGTYPNYEQLVPNNFGCKASFSSPLFLQRLSMIDTNAIYNGIVRYSFETTKTNEQICSIVSGNEDDGKYRISCPVKFEGLEAKIAFNHKYMIEATKPFSMCNLEITSPSSPGKITGNIDGLTIVVMPMFVEW